MAAVEQAHLADVKEPAVPVFVWVKWVTPEHAAKITAN